MNPRDAFEKQCLDALRARLRGSGWGKKDHILCREVDGNYVEAVVMVHRGEPRTHVACSFKPMAIDALLWEITGEAECARAPLSFRSWGVGVGATFPLLEEPIEQAGDSADVVAARILPCCSRALDVLRDTFGGCDFSALMARRIGQGEPGNLELTRILALVCEGRHDAARAAAEDSLRGRESPASRRLGKTPERQAIRWLEARGHA